MTLDIDELERTALRQRDEYTDPITGVDPDDVLALIERVRALEGAVKRAREQASGVVAALCVDEDD